MLRACFVIFFLLMGALIPSFAHAQSRAGQSPISANTSQNVSNVCTLAVNDMRIGINRLIQNIARIKECSAQGRLAVRISTDPDVIECREITQGHHIWENQSKTVRFYDAVSSSGASSGGYGLPGYLVGIQGNPGQSVLCERTYANCDICTLSGGGSGWWWNGACMDAEPTGCGGTDWVPVPCPDPHSHIIEYYTCPDGNCSAPQPTGNTCPSEMQDCDRCPANGLPTGGWWHDGSCHTVEPEACAHIVPRCTSVLDPSCFETSCFGGSAAWELSYGNCLPVHAPPRCGVGSGEKLAIVNCNTTHGHNRYTCVNPEGCRRNGIDYELGQYFDGAAGSCTPACDPSTMPEAAPQSCNYTSCADCNTCTLGNGDSGWWYNNSCHQNKPLACEACTPAWEAGGWGACSASCDGGTQEQTVTCKCNGATVADSQCPAASKPATTQACNTQSCSTPLCEPPLGSPGHGCTWVWITDPAMCAQQQGWGSSCNGEPPIACTRCP